MSRVLGIKEVGDRKVDLRPLNYHGYAWRIWRLLWFHIILQNCAFKPPVNPTNSMTQSLNKLVRLATVQHILFCKTTSNAVNVNLATAHQVSK